MQLLLLYICLPADAFLLDLVKPVVAVFMVAYYILCAVCQVFNCVDCQRLLTVRCSSLNVPAFVFMLQCVPNSFNHCAFQVMHGPFSRFLGHSLIILHKDKYFWH